MTTAEWASLLQISPDDVPPPVECSAEFSKRSAGEVAARVLVLQGVVAVAYGVPPEPVREWLREQDLGDRISSTERLILVDPPTGDPAAAVRWRQEAEWTLLWALGKVEALGLPVRTCDTRRMVDDLVPALGEDVSNFVASARLRPSSELLAEDDRTYDLYCRGLQRHRLGNSLPTDLIWPVLYQRRHAFEWLGGTGDWESVSCDA